jgi:uncharacterized protein
MFDVTLRCNLRCTYCFKEKRNENMPLRVAQDAIIWLIYASGSNDRISIQFMGGEPFLRMDLIEKLSPFGKRRAQAHGKTISFGATTNGTLVSKRIVEHAQKNGIAFHLSIDGIPEIQNTNRPLRSGTSSSQLIEKAAKRILAEQPNVMARASVVPENARKIIDSFHYFRGLGFTTLGFFPCESHRWNKPYLKIFEEQYTKVGLEIVKAYKQSITLSIPTFDRWFSLKSREKRGVVPCGSGRGLVLIDTKGNIWPCSRFSSHDPKIWCLGNIYEGFSINNRKPFMEGCPENKFYQNCDTCIATKICEGGCLAENLEVTGDIFQMSPNDCEINQIYARVGTMIHDILYNEKLPGFMKRFYLQE